jgi:type IV secretion system protein VirD4
VFGQLLSSLGFLATPPVLEACCADPSHPALDPQQLLDERGRIYLLGTSAAQRMAPLITALVETIARHRPPTCRRQPGGAALAAARAVHRRGTQIAPLPSLPSLLADGGGQGIVTCVILQSLGQASEAPRRCGTRAQPS